MPAACFADDWTSGSSRNSCCRAELARDPQNSADLPQRMLVACRLDGKRKFWATPDACASDTPATRQSLSQVCQPAPRDELKSRRYSFL